MSHKILSLSLLALLSATSACSEAKANEGRAPATPKEHISSAQVVEMPTPEILSLTGRLVADQRAEVTADTQGKVTAVYVTRGQRVKKGDPLVRLDVRAASLQTAEAAASLASTKAEKALADIECERSAKLFAQGAITRSEADRTATSCESAKSHVNAASARVSMSVKGVSDGLVRAPFDGVVAEKSVDVGEWVSPGRSLATLVDAAPMTIELSVPESAVSSVRLGQTVELSMIASPGKTYPATITRLGAEIGTSRSLIVEATVAPAPELVPGMFAEAAVVTGHTKHPAVPRSAAVQRGGEWHVFVLGDAELEDRVVQLGAPIGDSHIAVVANLAASDRVVLAPTPTTADGNVWSE